MTLTIFNVLQGSLTLVIAAIASCIAWQQSKTNQQRLKYEMYDRRVKVYETVKEYILLLPGNPITPADIKKLYHESAHADFLFGPEISKYMHELHEKGVQWIHLDGLTGERLTADACDEIQNLANWFNDQFAVAKEKFHKYLGVGN
jgi:hypothetical protein